MFLFLSSLTTDKKVKILSICLKILVRFKEINDKNQNKVITKFAFNFRIKLGLFDQKTLKKNGNLKRNPRMCQNNRISRSNADKTSEK